MRIDSQNQVVIILSAIRDCLKPGSDMAHLPDVVAICELNRMSHANVYNVIARWNNQYWRRIGSSIGLIK